MYEIYRSPASELYHHGIKGMKWGVRRYQNPDGSLTDEGRRRYLKGKSRYNYESSKTRKIGQKYGTDSDQYRKSSELDEKMAAGYRSQSALGKIASLVNPTVYNTYQMSKATGRGEVESLVRAFADINIDTALDAATVAGSVAIGGVVAGLSAHSGMKKLLSIPASQLSNTFAFDRLSGTTVKLGSEAGKKLAIDKITNEAVNKGVNVGEAAARGLRGGALAGANIMASRGREISAQQAWLRNNYINKGSVQEQKARKEKEREEKHKR